ncbi:MAG TPA: hypothetical protein PK239_13670 [Chitinophagales bacterium]|nr:hypothetical protein [Chitinophagales bacterium]HRK28318.1 hypothetical protein [Chitinophagales bacterium]
MSYYHRALGMVCVHPEQATVFVLGAEAIVQQDGNSKNDCELNAHYPTTATDWGENGREKDYSPFRPDQITQHLDQNFQAAKTLKALWEKVRVVVYFVPTTFIGAV